MFCFVGLLSVCSCDWGLSHPAPCQHYSKGFHRQAGEHVLGFLVVVWDHSARCACIGLTHTCSHCRRNAAQVPGKIQHILCTGNLVTRDTFDYLKTLASDVHVVAGDFDEGTYPEEKTVTIGDFKIGLCHGHKVVPWGDHESLSTVSQAQAHTHTQHTHTTTQKAAPKEPCPGEQTHTQTYIRSHAHTHIMPLKNKKVRRQMNVDVLISGHTHEFESFVDDGHLYLNPGSATGAYSATTSKVTPSFALMDIQVPVILQTRPELKGAVAPVTSTAHISALTPSTPSTHSLTPSHTPSHNPSPSLAHSLTRAPFLCFGPPPSSPNKNRAPRSKSLCTSW